MKVLMLTDMEGVDGIFDEELQCIPNKSPRWEESRKLLTGEINAAVEGLLEAGANEIVVWDGHWSGANLSTLDIHPKARLLTDPGRGFELDSSYGAMIFVGQHAMAGAEKGAGGYTFESHRAPHPDASPAARDLTHSSTKRPPQGPGGCSKIPSGHSTPSAR